MRAYRSKALVTWIALLLGALGIHRVVLYGWRDKLAWLHPWPSLIGLYGVLRMRALGQDDRLSWILIPLLGLMLSQAALCAIVYGLTPDAKWDAAHNPGQPGRETRWAPVLGVIASLVVLGMVLLGTIAFATEKFFVWQAEPAPAATQDKSRASP
ncbi:MAG: hypothetical protein KGL43_15055 [Burkholderiales bacterium]|nr:hypothetical protein [Burkholderiales bacterium]MDE2394589.1 hypothetical protein [Burkholderiales bacterium]MDE2454909.1 hypothetical protein [Burkholderiales bacterium]